MTVLFWNNIWLREKIQTFYHCFHNYPLGKAGLASLTDILNLDITDGSPAWRRRKSQLV